MEITDEIARRAAEKSEKAIFLIGRTAGEDKDYEDTEGSYLLTKREKENLRIVTKYFDEVAVLLNVSNIIDMSWTKDAAYQDHIKAIFYIWRVVWRQRRRCRSVIGQSDTIRKTDGYDCGETF